MKKNEILVELTSFITDKYGSFVVMNEDTRIENDLKITGDEAVDFLVGYGKSFNVDVSNFMAADYFEGEGFDFITPILEMFKLKKKKEKIKKILTIGDLIKGIESGRLDDEILAK